VQRKEILRLILFIVHYHAFYCSIIHDDKVDHYHSYIVAILNNIITFGFKNTHVFTCTCVYVKYDQVMMIIVTLL
jgi:hypothetical protein